MNKPLEVMVRELGTISRDFSKGMLEFVVPPKPVTNKPQLCKCRDCGRWHIKGN